METMKDLGIIDSHLVKSFVKKDSKRLQDVLKSD